MSLQDPLRIRKREVVGRGREKEGRRRKRKETKAERCSN